MRTWIFQGNPERFEINDYLAASSGLIVWSVTNYADQIAPGDTVYIWRSQGEEASLAGIVAEGTISEFPIVQPDDELSGPFWKMPQGEDETIRVKIRINRIASKREVLKRDWMKDDSVLKNMLIMRRPAGTNFPVVGTEAKRLGQLWRNTGKDWERAEVVAALWLYDQLHDKPISKLAGSEVETLAQQICRAPTGVYNKLMNLRAIDPNNSRKGFEAGSETDQQIWDEFFNRAKSELNGPKLRLEFDRLWGGVIKAERLADEVIEAEEKRLSEKPLEQLLSEYARRPLNSAPPRRTQEATFYDRDALVVALRKRLANHRCEVEGCKSERFQTMSDDFFVEVHHLVPLSDGGPDTLVNTAALCPTHHRMLHHGKDQELLANQLLQKRRLEMQELKGKCSGRAKCRLASYIDALRREGSLQSALPLFCGGCLVADKDGGAAPWPTTADQNLKARSPSRL